MTLGTLQVTELQGYRVTRLQVTGYKFQVAGYELLGAAFCLLPTDLRGLYSVLCVLCSDRWHERRASVRGLS